MRGIIYDVFRSNVQLPFLSAVGRIEELIGNIPSLEHIRHEDMENHYSELLTEIDRQLNLRQLPAPVNLHAGPGSDHLYKQDDAYYSALRELHIRCSRALTSSE